MKVLVAYASRAGSTKGIAEFIGEKLHAHGIDAQVNEVSSAIDVRGYDAFVIGSAVYMYHWDKGAKQFVERNRAVLSSHPVWLFSSGPVGTQGSDGKGHDLKETSVPSEITELMDTTKALEHRVFYGALFADKLGGAIGFTYNLMRKSKTIRDSMPEGDYRDWNDIEAWTNGIAETLTVGLVV